VDAYAGMTVSGVYQVNVTIPQLPDGDVSVSVTIAGATTDQTAFLPPARRMGGAMRLKKEALSKAEKRSRGKCKLIETVDMVEALLRKRH